MKVRAPFVASIALLALPGLIGCIAPRGSEAPLAARAEAVAEDVDWGVAPTAEIRMAEYHAPTPTRVAGGNVIGTASLASMMQEQDPVIVDVLGGARHPGLPGAVWLKGAGLGTGYDDDVQARLEAKLAELTGGDRSRPVVFYCLDPQCWLSYNAALRAARMGYENVYWYRGGINAWQSAGRQTVEVSETAW
ncbi:rhodanese-like domain-containing protein [Caenispirillum bisanense]|uniref:rhodanese-like domain-containing protein n=1 Tax=Caenispirillum bisanense TaxID=414052 RepID=UPI0031D04B77